MRFRSRLFYVLAILTAASAVCLISLISGGATEMYSANTSGMDDVATTIAASTWYAIIGCPGALLFVIFALLGWRNAAGARTERRHREQLEVMKSKSS
jgi:hypothetical protein